MKQIILDCENAILQPTIYLPLFKGCRAVIDTGSMVPTWLRSKEALIRAGGKITDSVVTAHTTAGKTEQQIYRINLVIGKENSECIVFPNLPIALNPMPSDVFENVHLLLPAPLFRGIRYQIDPVENKLNLDILDNQMVRLFKVECSNGSVIMASEI